MAQAVDEKKNDDNNDNDYDAKDTDSMFEKYKLRIEQFENNMAQFPLESNSIIGDNLSKYKNGIYKEMTQTYPICHAAVLSVAYNFLLLKKHYGSFIEKALYKNMTMIQFFDRIATKRAIVFYQKYDSFMLRNGSKSAGGWEAVGTDMENLDNDYGDKPLLAQYLSYDELLISALCGISSPTHFINDGDRRNNGRTGDDDLYPLTGIYMGLIGARFEKPYFMEYSLMIISPDQNTTDRGYGSYNNEESNDYVDNLENEINDKFMLNKIKESTEKSKSKPLIRNIFELFYSRNYLPIYSQINTNYKLAKDEKANKYSANILNEYFEKSYNYGYWGGGDDNDNNPYLDVVMFRRRVRVSLELFLFDSDRRSKLEKKSGFCHLVGLGAGYWSFKKSFQDREMVKVVKEIINDSILPNISCVYFAWFDEDSMKLTDDDNDDDKNNIFKSDNDGFYVMDFKKDRKIRIQFGKRNPASKPQKEFENDLICAMYAWDSNSFVGNEYYFGMLSASGDPAAAACSTISYAQNSEINTEYVNGKNTAFYFFNEKTRTYEFKKLKDINFEQNTQKWLEKSILSIPYKRSKLANKL